MTTGKDDKETKTKAGMMDKNGNETDREQDKELPENDEKTPKVSKNEVGERNSEPVH